LKERDVREDLYGADWISVKIDAMSYEIWRRINKPHKVFKLYKILEGILEFSKNFRGELNTESMLIRNLNDSEEEIEKIANMITKIGSTKSYISIPTRPPTEAWVKPPGEEMINKAYQIFSKNFIDTEYLIGYEGNAFAFTGNVEKDLLGITAVHPMRKDGVEQYLSKAGSNWEAVEKLVKNNKLKEVRYRDKTFYLRKI